MEVLEGQAILAEGRFEVNITSRLGGRFQLQMESLKVFEGGGVGVVLG